MDGTDTLPATELSPPPGHDILRVALQRNERLFSYRAVHEPTFTLRMVATFSTFCLREALKSVSNAMTLLDDERVMVSVIPKAKDLYTKAAGKAPRDRIGFQSAMYDAGRQFEHDGLRKPRLGDRAARALAQFLCDEAFSGTLDAADFQAVEYDAAEVLDQTRTNVDGILHHPETHLDVLVPKPGSPVKATGYVGWAETDTMAILRGAKMARASIG